MILIAYDGSQDSKSAIEYAGTLMPGQPAIVLTVWETFVQMLARSAGPFGLVAGVDDVTEIDARAEPAPKRAPPRAPGWPAPAG
jgi:hypothetical protein